LAYKFLERRGYSNMKVLREGIPGWAQKKYPMEGRRLGAVEHRPYPSAVREFEQRLLGSTARAPLATP
jgi:hypothetical protein